MLTFLKHTAAKKIIALLLVSAIIAPSVGILLIPKETEASVPTHCSFIDFNCIKEGVLDLIARAFAVALIRSLRDMIISWIQGDGGRNVGFVGNLEQEFGQQIDIRGGEFLNQLSGINMCGSIGAFLQISLRSSTSYRQQFACTVTDIVDNVQNFFDDFSQGGWPAFIRITHDPQNNPYGAFLLAFDAKIQAESAAAAALERNLLINNGFKGVEKKLDAKCEGNDAGTLQCQTQYIIKTPGRLISDLLSKTVSNSYDFGDSVHEIDEAFTDIILTLVQKLIGSVQDGIFNSDLAHIASDNSHNGNLGITTQTHLPQGKVGVPYNQQLQATNGVPPYTWNIVQGSLPPGLTLSPSGLLSGIPTGEGTYAVLVQVTDTLGETDLQPLTIEIGTPVGTLPSGGFSPPLPGDSSPPPPTSGSITSMPNMAAEIIALTNQERAKVGKPPLTVDARLTQAAEEHSKDMAQHDSVEHTGSNGSTPDQRIAAAGYPVSAGWGENVAGGQSSAAEAVNGWMNSPEHKDNILGNVIDFHSIGVSVFYNPDGLRHYYYTQDFGGQ